MKIAILGRGSMGAAHARAYAALGRGDEIGYIVATTDAPGLADAPRATVITDPRRALADPEVDVVSVCTPTATHLELALAALQAGKHVLLEKPMALSAADARTVAARAARAPGVLMVAQVVRFFAGYQRVRQAVDAGRIGRVLAVRAARSVQHPPHAWWWDESLSGGPIVDVGVHDFDQAGWYLGRPVAVRAVRPALDGGPRVGGPIEATVGYAGGGISQVRAWANAAEFASSIEVVGELGVAAYRLPGPTAEAGAASAAAAHFPTGEFSLRTTQENVLETISEGDPYVRQADYFLNCARQDQATSHCPIDESLHATLAALAARDSLRSGGQRVEL